MSTPAEAVAQIDARAVAILRVRAGLHREIRDRELTVSVLENELRLLDGLKARLGAAAPETDPEPLPGESGNAHQS